MATAKRVIRNAATPSTKVTIDTGPGLTKQNHKAECDVNLILQKFQRTGVIAHRVEHQAQYDDATGIDFQEAMNLVTTTQEMFNDLPSSLRKKFNHEPAQFLKYVNDPNNLEEMIELGLATRQEPEPPIQVTVTNPPPSETPSEPPQ